MHHIHQQRAEYRNNTVRRRRIHRRVRKRHLHREDHACKYRNHRRQHRTEHIQNNDGTDYAAMGLPRIGKRAHYQKEHQKRRDSLERSHKYITEHADAGRAGYCQSQNNTDNQAHNNPFDKTYPCPFFPHIFHRLPPCHAARRVDIFLYFLSRHS